MKKINKNVVIVATILILAVIAGYLVWLRTQQQPTGTPELQRASQLEEASPSPTPMLTAAPTATASAQASASATPKGAKATVKPATGAGTLRR